MIKARRIYSKPAKPYCSKYGSRRWQRSEGNINTLVNFSFLLSRKGLDVNHLQELTPEWKKDMRYMIKNLDRLDHND